MKIVCDACQAKYSIADDKIQGKAFKIRCKKCNHIIVVKTSGEVASGSASSSAEKQKPAAPTAAAASTPDAGAEQGVWHVVVDGEQVGPLTEDGVKEKLRANQINGESLVWKEGFADWTALSTVSELAALPSKGQTSGARAVVAEPAHAASSAAAVAKAASSKGKASSSYNADDGFAASSAVTPPPSADVFASVAAPVPAQAVPSPVAPAPSSPFLFGGGPAQPAEPVVVVKNPSTGSGGTHLTGQRNENSVLFSLSNLEALAVPSGSSGGGGIRPPSSNSNTEGSGLIDIRSMAAMTMNDGATERRSSESLPTFSTPQFSPVAPVLLPISNSGPPKWIYPVLGLLAVGILVLGYGIYRVMGAPAPGTPVVIQAPAAPVAPPTVAAPVAAAPAVVPSPSAAVVPEPTKPVVEEKPAPVAEGKPSTSKGTKGSGKGEKGHHKGDSSKGDKKGSDSVASDSKGKGVDSGKGKGSTGSVASDVVKREEPPRPAPPQVKLVSLNQSDIVNAMKGVQSRVQMCANQYKVPGTAMANVTVASGGKVGNVTVTGKFAGTPTGSCLESAAKSAKFPPCQGMTFPWPFSLTPR